MLRLSDQVICIGGDVDGTEPCRRAHSSPWSCISKLGHAYHFARIGIEKSIAPFSVGRHQSMTVPRKDLGRERALGPFSSRQRGARGYGGFHWINQENQFAHSRRQTRMVGCKEEIPRFAAFYSYVTDGGPAEVMQMNSVVLRNRQ